MTKFYIGSTELKKWLHQNNGTAVDCVEGCLLDNLLVETKRGLVIIKEHFLNTWSSDYYCEFVPWKLSMELYKKWEELCAA